MHTQGNSKGEDVLPTGLLAVGRYGALYGVRTSCGAKAWVVKVRCAGRAVRGGARVLALRLRRLLACWRAYSVIHMHLLRPLVHPQAPPII
jgi:hypothetical protein